MPRLGLLGNGRADNRLNEALTISWSCGGVDLPAERLRNGKGGVKPNLAGKTG
jgi:hypothetical protein